MGVFRLNPHAVLLTLATFTVVGCPDKAPPPRPPGDTENLSKIERAYDAASGKLGHPPQNVEQLRPYLTDFGDPDEILRSPRDGQPYVIIYGVPIRRPFEMPPPIWAHEKTGVDGKRYVLTVMGVVLMSDEEFAQAKFVKP